MWIAFKICIFVIRKQPKEWKHLLRSCCELLSKFVSLSFENNKITELESRLRVVNCFQNLYLCHSKTTCYANSLYLSSLWIAFKICIFVIRKQPSLALLTVVGCCELLSKFVSLSFENNTIEFYQIAYLLWIAFKICIFVIRKQLLILNFLRVDSCELLSKFVSLSFENNCNSYLSLLIIVVNCFQNLYLCHSKTTIIVLT